MLPPNTVYTPSFTSFSPSSTVYIFIAVLRLPRPAWSLLFGIIPESIGGSRQAGSNIPGCQRYLQRHSSIDILQARPHKDLPIRENQSYPPALNRADQRRLFSLIDSGLVANWFLEPTSYDLTKILAQYRPPGCLVVLWRICH